MSVPNSLVKKVEDKVVEYEVNGEKVKLSPNIIKNFLVSGGGNVTDQEVVMFLNLCRFQHLNPFLREAYLIKFGNSPATMVTGKEVFTKRAKRNKEYLGQEAGVVVQRDDGSLENRIGTIVLPNETLVGGWARVFISGYQVPIEISVAFEEYVGRKASGEINGQWEKKPATMIRKVALVQALREAFPEELGALNAQEEMGIEQTLDENPISNAAYESTAEGISDVRPPFDVGDDPFAK